MTTVITATNLLFGSEDPGGALAGAATERSIDLGALSIAGVSVPESDIWSHAGSIFDEPIVNVAMRGWRALEQVRTARARTLEFPGTTETVRPLKPTIESTQEPTIRVSVGPVTNDVVTLTLTMKIVVEAAVLTITDGEIAKVEAGSATASATLLIAETTLIERTSEPVDLNFLRLVS